MYVVQCCQENNFILYKQSCSILLCTHYDVTVLYMILYRQCHDMFLENGLSLSWPGPSHGHRSIHILVNLQVVFNNTYLSM